MTGEPSGFVKPMGLVEENMLRKLPDDRLVIRPARPDDLERIMEIQVASPESSQWDAASYLGYDCLVAEEYVEEQVEEAGNEAAEPVALASHGLQSALEKSGKKSAKSVAYFVLQGFLVSRHIGPGEREILNVAVDPSARRRGVAKRLVEAEIARADGAWFLEVRESNSAARQLYEGFGFQQVGRREHYYQDPPESGIVMRVFS